MIIFTLGLLCVVFFIFAIGFCLRAMVEQTIWLIRHWRGVLTAALVVAALYGVAHQPAPDGYLGGARSSVASTQ